MTLGFYSCAKTNEKDPPVTKAGFPAKRQTHLKNLGYTFALNVTH
jgi:hypothetical protein